MPQVSDKECREFYELVRFIAEEDLDDLCFLFPREGGRVECHLNMNDVFYYATADSEPISFEDIPELKRALEECRKHDKVLGDIYGCRLFVARRRGILPLADKLPDEPEFRRLFQNVLDGG